MCDNRRYEKSFDIARNKTVNVNIRTVSFLNGVMLCGLAVALLIPLLYDIIANHGKCVNIFLPSIIVCVFIGVSAILSCKEDSFSDLSRHDTFLIVVCFWVIISFFSAFPFYLYKGFKLDFMSALFEATSGITVTGASVYNNIEKLPEALVLWRFILHFIGGVGIVAIGIIAFPMMRIGGMQLFQLESSDKINKLLPRSSQMASFFLLTYTVLIGIIAILLNISGMNGFDSVCHSISAISTGGFSTKNNGLIFYDSKTIKLIMAIGMFIGGITFLEIVRCMKNGFKSFYSNQQTKLYINIVLIVPTLIIIHSFIKDGKNVSIDTVIDHFFEIISFFTSTCLTLSDETSFSPFVKLLCLVAAISGACSGSTSGGLKLFRLQILYSILKNHIKKLLKPINASVHKYQGVKIDDQLIISVVSVIVMFAVTFVVSTFVVCVFGGLDCSVGASSVCSCLFNSGMSMSFFTNDALDITFFDLNSFVKITLITDMLVGRLEIIPVFVILSRTFWK